jgi:hypothetical protein
MDKRGPKHKHALPEDTDELTRAIRLARRLYTGTNAKGGIVCTLPKLLDPPESPYAKELLWAAIGRKLALKEPEFSPGRGRKRGSKDRQPRGKEPEISGRNKILRRYRDKKARKKRTIPIPGRPGQLYEPEPGESFDPPWKR